MIRLVLAGLAVLFAALAFLTGQTWLYAAAGGIGGVALGMGAHWLWKTQIAGKQKTTNAGDDAESLGISKVRPMTPPSDQDETNDASSKSSSKNGSESSTSSSSESSDRPKPDRPKPDRSKPDRSKKDTASPASSSHAATEPPSSPERSGQQSASRQSAEKQSTEEGDARVVAFVRALRHVLQAETVALLVQEEMALEYRIAGLDSRNGNVRHSGTFSTPQPLLTASMSRSKVTVRTLDEAPNLRDALNYYTTTPAIDKVAFAPIQHAQQSATYFLVVDGTKDVPLSHHHTQRLLVRSAETLGHMLSYNPNTLRPSVASQRSSTSGRDASNGDTRSNGNSSFSDQDAASVDMTTPSPNVERQEPRPRSEIIAEEMEVARATEIPLALALIHLNRSEMIAERGQTEVDRTEALLLEALEEAAPRQRVERFGELTYGVFYQAPLETVEEWTLNLHRSMMRETNQLKGGVSIGVTMMGPRHKDSKIFRAEVMKALHEAYKSGAPVVID